MESNAKVCKLQSSL